MQNDIYDLKTDLANSKIGFNEQISLLKRENLELVQVSLLILFLI